MPFVTIERPGEKKPGTIAQVSGLVVTEELRAAWDRQMEAIEASERFVDTDQHAIRIC